MVRAAAHQHTAMLIGLWILQAYHRFWILQAYHRSLSDARLWHRVGQTNSAGDKA